MTINKLEGRVFDSPDFESPALLVGLHWSISPSFSNKGVPQSYPRHSCRPASKRRNHDNVLNNLEYE